MSPKVDQKMQNAEEQTGHHFKDVAASKWNKLSIEESSKKEFSRHFPRLSRGVNEVVSQKDCQLMQNNAKKTSVNMYSAASSIFNTLPIERCKKNEFSDLSQRISRGERLLEHQNSNQKMKLSAEKDCNGLYCATAKFDICSIYTNKNNKFFSVKPRLSRVTSKVMLQKDGQNVQMNIEHNKSDASNNNFNNIHKCKHNSNVNFLFKNNFENKNEFNEFENKIYFKNENKFKDKNYFEN
jgi:hypothetical protein